MVQGDNLMADEWKMLPWQRKLFEQLKTIGPQTVLYRKDHGLLHARKMYKIFKALGRSPSDNKRDT